VTAAGQPERNMEAGPPLIFSVPFALTTCMLQWLGMKMLLPPQKNLSARTGNAWFYFQRVKAALDGKENAFHKEKK
jgi:hypothetical protein